MLNELSPGIAADVQTTSVDFGVVRQGDLVAERTITVGNAAMGALTDVLTGGFSAVAAPFRGTGNLGAGVAAGDTDNASLSVGLDTGSAGFFGGDANLALSSHNEEMTDLSLGTFQIGLDAQVNALAGSVPELDLYQDSKFISIDKKADHDIVHFFQLGETNGFSNQPLDSRS